MDKETKDSIEEIKKYAKDNDVPIMLDDGIEFLTDFIVQKNIKNILEVGTAIGFSSIMMALQNDKIRVTTIERDEERYLEAAKEYVKVRVQSTPEEINGFYQLLSRCEELGMCQVMNLREYGTRVVI